MLVENPWTLYWASNVAHDFLGHTLTGGGKRCRVNDIDWIVGWIVNSGWICSCRILYYWNHACLYHTCTHTVSHGDCGAGLLLVPWMRHPHISNLQAWWNTPSWHMGKSFVCMLMQTSLHKSGHGPVRLFFSYNGVWIQFKQKTWDWWLFDGSWLWGWRVETH